MVLGGDSASEWVHIFRGAGYVAGANVQVVTKSLDSSDHISFINNGVPGVQLFTGAHGDYHKPSDTVDGIDPQGLIKVALKKRARERSPLVRSPILLSRVRVYGWTGRLRGALPRRRG
jgi:Zn-dependent M28 family amino/carboxypeptidase